MISKRKLVGKEDGANECHSVKHELLTKSSETEPGTHRQEPTNMKGNHKYIEYIVVFRQWVTLQFPGRMTGE